MLGIHDWDSAIAVAAAPDIAQAIADYEATEARAAYYAEAEAAAMEAEGAGDQEQQEGEGPVAGAGHEQQQQYGAQAPAAAAGTAVKLGSKPATAAEGPQPRQAIPWPTCDRNPHLPAAAPEAAAAPG